MGNRKQQSGQMAQLACGMKNKRRLESPTYASVFNFVLIESRKAEKLFDSSGYLLDGSGRYATASKYAESESSSIWTKLRSIFIKRN